ncbi:MAG: hypothetical protein [Caudoviricetes sp.]|nr:MAG: hypothetical protein [Caudoviricetes sp.]
MEPIKTIDNVCVGYFTLNGERHKIVTFEEVLYDSLAVNRVTVCIKSPSGYAFFGVANSDKANALSEAINDALYELKVAGVKCDIDSETISKTLKRID